mgnify:CR=1 FL=1
MIKDRNTTVLATDIQSTEQMKKFLVHCTGAKLTPVVNKTDAFWISGDQFSGSGNCGNKSDNGEFHV